MEKLIANKVEPPPLCFIDMELDKVSEILWIDKNG